MPGINDAEIPKLITFARECGAGKKFPPLGIQKFERYKYGRTPKGVKVQSWWQFFNRSIKEWEKASGLVLRLDPKRDFGTVHRPSLPLVFKKGEKTNVEIRAPRLDPRRAARSGKKPGGLGLWLRQGIRPDPGKISSLRKTTSTWPCRFDPDPVFSLREVFNRRILQKGLHWRKNSREAATLTRYERVRGWCTRQGFVVVRPVTRDYREWGVVPRPISLYSSLLY